MEWSENPEYSPIEEEISIDLIVLSTSKDKFDLNLVAPDAADDASFLIFELDQENHNENDYS